MKQKMNNTHALIAHISCSSDEFKTGKVTTKEKRIKKLASALGYQYVEVVKVVQGHQYRFAFRDAAKLLKHAFVMRSSDTPKEIFFAIEDREEFMRKLNEEMHFMLHQFGKVMDVDDVYDAFSQMAAISEFEGFEPEDENWIPLDLKKTQ